MTENLTGGSGNTKGRKENYIMKISEAVNLTQEDFEQLDKDCHGFDDERYKNSPVREHDESFMEFLLEGSEKIKHSPMIHGKLL